MKHGLLNIGFLFVGMAWTAGLSAPAADVPALRDFRLTTWEIDARPVLERGGDASLDQRVVGDPCIVWDDAVQTWRMFYFASGRHPTTRALGPRTAMALAKSAEAVGPGDWQKQGLVEFTNPEALINRNDFHKWWVVMDALRPNRAARIDGRYWAVFTASKPLAGGRLHKHLQIASSNTLAGPWTLRATPILAPGADDALDALHADTPSAFWFEDEKRVAIFYKGYPTQPQFAQPKAPFGSGTMLVTWHPSDRAAPARGILMRAGIGDTWNQGWMSSIQLLHTGSPRQWYGLHNASPTPPADQSHREPAPSLGGWVVCNGHPLSGTWRAETVRSPFRHPDQLTSAEKAAGLGTNFWRHHLLITPAGQIRIFFNSGAYGKEQMYSLVPRE